jgi:dephospho-CoA kinase
MVAEEIRQILHAQMPIKKKLDYAHFIVDNSGTFVSTVQQIAWLSRKLIRK